jgi:hypothetical protein
MVIDVVTRSSGISCGLSLFEQVAKALIGLGGRAETGEHTHGPRPAAVHRRLHAARERVLARKAQIAQVVELHIRRRQQIRHVDAARGAKLRGGRARGQA